ncbi:bifunctional UDP-N-acetylglucosamine diphosphorylase/glucosamine-1-phosphate N-acetyltransferase GlmU [Pedomonas mirosovicensis]|uniref:bifunctional UDP-N-acetylglucosamine diphosphorylase/glucosamine-1-phosphate N-acetyltransferase GlmU n=1 Tax=Pedomonas mirosovicensis TaxID=2908641 RepID=UPI0021672649|nr:bifunctional UDP-N-acetylglucosamine diphosphorylase/glucosamine-1-phosphate N-acetyltransferase GlmU [Pedomonas mirosovicensis]MCH8684342.1 bifunctional UDP-N-acetylglucosamine diphosphorylase/glucosamine-1-phosphate N-acetyltransferase GlmU [Pedomonas mirosovicensis]
MTTRPVAVIILAAGKGTRMKSDKHKVLHPIGGLPMVGHVLKTAEALDARRSVLVVGSLKEQVEAAFGHKAAISVQEPQLGTAHAVQAAQGQLADFDGDILILYGDVPLIRPETLRAMLERLNTPVGGQLPACVVLAFRPQDPAAYGRIITDENGVIETMVEFKDASPEQRAINLCNSGVMAVKSEQLWSLLSRVDNDNAAGEYYLPDVVMLARQDGLPSLVVETGEEEVAGVNSRVELAAVEQVFQNRRRREMMLDGVTLIAPETVFFSHDTVIGRDVVIEPNVVFGPGVTVESGAVIRAFSHLEGASVGAGCEVGPYARLRPGAVMKAKAKVGNFVEIKKAVLEAGAKVNHLTYIGDAHVGEKANIGAGTITCNYDGYNKSQTRIGAGAFIGSNSSLVAPVTIGDGAIIGAGSVVTQDVAADALAVARGQQVEKQGWAARFRAAMQSKKKAG